MLFFCALLFKSVRYAPPVVAIRPGRAFLFLQITSLPSERLSYLPKPQISTRREWGMELWDHSGQGEQSFVGQALKEGCSSNCGLIAQALALRTHARGWPRQEASPQSRLGTAPAFTYSLS